ncbi:MAG TPA: hypothetical protein PKV33_01865 [Methanothrix sp.]|mgnify:CR=1 FL=1|nr:hypothetical protein [Methanothrix sp.]
MGFKLEISFLLLITLSLILAHQIPKGITNINRHFRCTHETKTIATELAAIKKNSENGKETSGAADRPAPTVKPAFQRAEAIPIFRWLIPADGLIIIMVQGVDFLMLCEEKNALVAA